MSHPLLVWICWSEQHLMMEQVIVIVDLLNWLSKLLKIKTLSWNNDLRSSSQFVIWFLNIFNSRNWQGLHQSWSHHGDVVFFHFIFAGLVDDDFALLIWFCLAHLAPVTLRNDRIVKLVSEKFVWKLSINSLSTLYKQDVWRPKLTCNQNVEIYPTCLAENVLISNKYWCRNWFTHRQSHVYYAWCKMIHNLLQYHHQSQHIYWCCCQCYVLQRNNFHQQILFWYFPWKYFWWCWGWLVWLVRERNAEEECWYSD